MNRYSNEIDKVRSYTRALVDASLLGQHTEAGGAKRGSEFAVVRAAWLARSKTRLTWPPAASRPLGQEG